MTFPDGPESNFMRSFPQPVDGLGLVTQAMAFMNVFLGYVPARQDYGNSPFPR